MKRGVNGHIINVAVRFVSGVCCQEDKERQELWR